MRPPPPKKKKKRKKYFKMINILVFSLFSLYCDYLGKLISIRYKNEENELCNYFFFQSNRKHKPEQFSILL